MKHSAPVSESVIRTPREEAPDVTPDAVLEIDSLQASLPSAETRTRDIPTTIERRTPSQRAAHAAEKRNQSDRRRLVDPTTCERDYTDDETAFMKAMERYKRENRRPFPTWSEVLEVLHSLGYRKVAETEALPGGRPIHSTKPIKADKSVRTPSQPS